ncbi:MAG: hypothetical protein QM820_10330 [Minicystis sp.]
MTKLKHPPQRHGRSDDGHAFLPDLDGGRVRVKDDLAEEVAEAFLEGATSGEAAFPDTLGNEQTEEVGGPFVETTGKQEFGKGVDASNPRGAEREAFPRANAGPVKR